MTRPFNLTGAPLHPSRIRSWIRSNCNILLTFFWFVRHQKREKDKQMRDFIRPARPIQLTSLLLCATTGMWGADVPSDPSQAAEIQALKLEVAEQRKMIEELRLLLMGQQKDLHTSPAAANTAPEKNTSSAVPIKGIGEIASVAPLVPSGPGPTPKPDPLPVVPPAPVPEPQGEQPSPLQLRIGDATITPVGFMD